MAPLYDDETRVLKISRVNWKVPASPEKEKRDVARRTTVVLDRSFPGNEAKAFREIGLLLLIASLIPFAAGTGLLLLQDWGSGICAFLLGAAFLLPVRGVLRRKPWGEWTAFFLCGATSLVSLLATVGGPFGLNLFPGMQRLDTPSPLVFFLLPVFLLLVFFIGVHLALALWSGKPKRDTDRSTQ